jgi:hypothetical protein
MERSDTMTVFSTTRYGKLVSVISTILLLLFLPGLARALTPDSADRTIQRGKTAAGFYYMMGGLGVDEQLAMEQQSASYNLKLVFSRSSLLISPVLLLIGDNQSRRVEKIVVRGPWFYIQLPSGGYTILARIRDKVVLVRDIYLREKRRAIYFLRGD